MTRKERIKLLADHLARLDNYFFPYLVYYLQAEAEIGIDEE